MCNACVMNSLKQRLLDTTAAERVAVSRRRFLGGALGTVAAASLGAGARGAHAMEHSSVADMTHELFADFPTYFGEPGFASKALFTYAEHQFNLLELTINEHTGTHVDAPLHFSEDGQSVAEIPVEHLVVPLCVIDIRARAEADVDAQVTPEDLKAWIDANGPIPDKACVAMNSGWSSLVASDRFRGADDEGTMHFPGFHVDAASMLIEETGAVGMAVDTLSLDHGPSPDFATHYAWLPTNRWGIENLANLDAVPASGATLVVGAPKHRGGSGGPARIFAMI